MNNTKINRLRKLQYPTIVGIQKSQNFVLANNSNNKVARKWKASGRAPPKRSTLPIWNWVPTSEYLRIRYSMHAHSPMHMPARLSKPIQAQGGASDGLALWPEF